MTDNQSAPIDRRRDLLQAARGLFQERGFNRTPVSAIVQGAGVSQGTFYLYFKSKQALLAELRRDVFRAYASTLTAIAQLDAPEDERLARVVVAMADVVSANQDLETMFRYADSGEDSHLAVREGRSRLAELAATFIRQGTASGVFAPNPHPTRTAALVVALFDDVLFDTVAFEPQALEEVLAASLRLVLGGLGVPSARVEALVDNMDAWRTQ